MMLNEELSEKEASCLWQCPLCQQALNVDVAHKQYRCATNHCFDIAKEGYVNLILVNKKRSKSPGDSKEMIQARKLFLAAGYYQNLADKLACVVFEYAPDSAAQILEVGCGEGYYLRHLEGACNDTSTQFHGLDISKDAVKLAAKKAAKQNYSVASSFSMPVQDDSMDVVMRVFAPAPSTEIQRVLKDNAVFIVVTPGPKHLHQLRQKIYKQATDHENIITSVEDFELIKQFELSDEILIDQPEHVSALLQMTPYYWQASEQVQAELDHLETLSCQTDFVISVYKKEADVN